MEVEPGKLNIIVAFTSKNRFIGLDGDLPWKRALTGDMKYVSKLIHSRPDNVLIVGRRTFGTLWRIKDVRFLVVSASPVEQSNAVHARSFAEAVEYAKKNNLCPIVFGGVEIYRDALKMGGCKLFVTIVEEDGLQGDCRFPEWDLDLKNVSGAVERLLLESGVKKNWVVEDDCFVENGFQYKFYIGTQLN